MCAYFRQTCIYPNVFIMDQLATLIRYVRPISVDLTEISFWCLAPVDEPAEVREVRLRQFEEFFMASGMGTTDDNAEFEEVSDWCTVSGAAVEQSVVWDEEPDAWAE